MAQSDPIDFDSASPPFDQFQRVERLAPARSGRDSVEHARHRLYVGRHKHSTRRVLIKLTAKPGLVYQHDLANEIESLTTVNRELPGSTYFPAVHEHGQLRDGRVYLIMSLFNELPLATTIGDERMPAKMVSHLRTTIEVARALTDLHGLDIFHVDLNPMNILHRSEKGSPVVKIVDFESSYERRRHSTGVFYNPPTTSGYSAPEVCRQPPDARSDLFSLGAVLYTMLAGFQWTWKSDVGVAVAADRQLDPELRGMLLTAVDPDPAKRHPSITVFQAALADYLERIWPGRSW